MQPFISISLRIIITSFGYYTIFSQINQGEALNIINSVGIAYHQHEVLYLIKPQGKYTLTRDEIQPQRG